MSARNRNPAARPPPVAAAGARRYPSCRSIGGTIHAPDRKARHGGGHHNRGFGLPCRCPPSVPQHRDRRQLDDRDAGRGGFQDGVGRERWRHVDHRGVGAGGLYGILDGVEHRQADVLAAALAGRDAADHLGAVIEHLLGVEGTLRAGETLHDDFGVFID